MLKQAASVVLALLKGSTYGKEYVSPSRSLRPRWMAFLNILDDEDMERRQDARYLSLWRCR